MNVCHTYECFCSLAVSALCQQNLSHSLVSVLVFFKVITGIPSHYRRYKLMFESLIDDMSHPKEAKNDPYRLEPASNTDTGM